MSMNFEPFYGWQNVVDPENPQPGAKRVTSEDLLRYEHGLEDTETALAKVFQEIPDAINSQMAVIAERVSDSAIWPDPNALGLYHFRQGGQLVPSEVPGLYLIDPNKNPMPSYEIPPGVMVVVNEKDGTYVRPSDNPDYTAVFTGVSDPGAKALENDRWENLTTAPGEPRKTVTYVRKSNAWV